MINKQLLLLMMTLTSSLSNAFIASPTSSSLSFPFLSTHHRNSKSLNLNEKNQGNDWMDIHNNSFKNTKVNEFATFALASIFFSCSSFLAPDMAMAIEKTQPQHFPMETMLSSSTTTGFDVFSTNILLGNEEGSKEEAVVDESASTEQSGPADPEPLSEEEQAKQNTRQEALNAIIAATTARKSNEDGAIVTNLESDLKSLQSKIQTLAQELEQQDGSASAESKTKNFIIPLKKLRDEEVRLTQKITSERNLQEIRMKRFVEEAPRRQRQKEAEEAKQRGLDRIDRLNREESKRMDDKRAMKLEELKALKDQTTEFQL